MKRNEALAILNRILHTSGKRRPAKAIFDRLPALQQLSMKLCWWLSPYIQLDEGNLLELAVVQAVQAFHKEPGTDRDKARAYIAGISSVAGMLSSLRISVRTKAGDWELWDYDMPLVEFMTARGAHAVQTRTRQKHRDRGPITLYMLSAICTMKDLRLMRDVITLAEAG